MSSTVETVLFFSWSIIHHSTNAGWTLHLNTEVRSAPEHAIFSYYGFWRLLTSDQSPIKAQLKAPVDLDALVLDHCFLELPVKWHQTGLSARLFSLCPLYGLFPSKNNTKLRRSWPQTEVKRQTTVFYPNQEDLLTHLYPHLEQMSWGGSDLGPLLTHVLWSLSDSLKPQSWAISTQI